jgi:tetratricopeptide (TPR) repeat protein
MKTYPHHFDYIELIFPGLLLLLIPFLAVSASLSSPQTAEAFHEKGRNFYEERKYSLAIAQYTRAIALDSANAIYYNSRANAYYFQARSAPFSGDRINALELAAADYTQSIQRNPHNAHGYRYRGEVQIQLGNRSAGIEDLHQAALIYQAAGNESNYRSVVEHLRQLQ